MSDSPLNPFASFWREPAAAAWFSAGNATSLASTILSTCGGGPVLDLGCGAGRLLAAIRQLGITARGTDSSPEAVALCNAQAPGSVTNGDALNPTLADASFDTVVCTGLPDLLDDAQLAMLLEQMRRIARRSVILVTASAPWPAQLNVTGHARTRAQVQAIAFEAGLRRHPAELRAVSYAALEADLSPRIMMFEPLSEEVCQRFPLSWLEQHRDLHHDHLRSSGRRADAHLARYALACDLVREGDRVLDIACGMGYGSRMLALTSTAATVRGIDTDPRALAYAQANFASASTSFTQDDAHLLTTVPDACADVIVSFETLEHLPEPAAFLDRAANILRPGGRLIVSVPNQWADETGNDPNPHHHHVYSFEKLNAQVGSHFIIEQTFRQTAGGGWKLGHEPRRLEPLSSESATAPAEWLVMVAMKSPIGADASFVETLFPPQPESPDYNLYNFRRDYDNPALFRSLICMGPRLADDSKLTALAHQVLAISRPGSPDQGAAVCVLAYQTLANPDAQDVHESIGRIDAFASASDGTPHAIRWVISGQYVAAQLLMAIGRRDEALARFESCASMDAAAFSPVLGTKTVDAACWAGILHAFAGDVDAARVCWKMGIKEARRLTGLPWLNVIGQEDAPQPYGLLELSHVLDAASHCAGWLNAAARLAEQPGLAVMLARRQTAGDTRQYIKDLLAAKRWLQGQLSAGAARNDDLPQEVQRLRESIATLESGRSWLSEQVRSFKAAAEKSAADYEQARQWGKAADQGRLWLDAQLGEARTREAAQLKTIEQLKAHIKSLEEGKAWLDGQFGSLSELAKDRERIIGELRAHIKELQDAKVWLDGQHATLAALAKDRERIIAEFRTYIEQLEAAKAWHATQLENARTQAAAAAERAAAQIAAQAAVVSNLQSELAIAREAAASDRSDHAATLARLHEELAMTRETSAVQRKEQEAAIARLEEELAKAAQAAATQAAWAQDRVRGLLGRGWLDRLLNRDRAP